MTFKGVFFASDKIFQPERNSDKAYPSQLIDLILPDNARSS